MRNNKGAITFSLILAIALVLEVFVIVSQYSHDKKVEKRDRSQIEERK